MPKIKKSDSPVVEAQEEKKEPLEESLILTPEQERRHNSFIQMCRDAKEQRDQSYTYFDDMTYEDDYHANQKASNAYLRPKLNDDEVRIVTGATEKKLEVLSNEVLSMNMEPEVIAYDDADNELKNLGQDMMDVVKRTDDMEKDEDFWQAWLRELLSQRAVFFEEVDDYQTYNYRKPLSLTPDNPNYASIKKSKERIIHKARKRLISGLRVYLGDMFIPSRNFQTDQPYIVVYAQRSYSATKQIYGGWDRWKFVKPGKHQDETSPNYYRMNDVSENTVEECHIIDPVNGEHYLILNGVPMFEESMPLWYDVLPDRRYTFSMVTIKEMDTEFAYGKPPVASAKTMQALSDESMRNLILKFRQAIEPAMAVNSNNAKAISRDIFRAGAITQGMKQDDVFPINPRNQGITQAEFNFYNLIEEKTAEFVGTGQLQQGQAPSGEQTATEIQQLQTNATKNLGHIVLAYMRARRDAPYLRIYNILENFVSPVKTHLSPATNEITAVYEKFTANNALFTDGKRGKKIVQFTDRNMTPLEKDAVFDFELQEEKAGRPTRFRTINIKQLAKINVFWHIVVNQQRREGSALNKILFKDEMEQAVAISEITNRQINGNKIVDEFEHRWQVSGFFQEEQAQPQQQEKPEGAEELSKRIRDTKARTMAGSQLTEGPRAATQKPSLNETTRQ